MLGLNNTSADTHLLLKRGRYSNNPPKFFAEQKIWAGYFPKLMILISPKNIFISGALLLLLFHLIANLLSLYYIYPNFNIFMHIFGGFIIASGFLYFTNSNSNAGNKIFWKAILAVFIAGIAWEIFEVLIGYTNPENPGYWTGSAIDVLWGVVGSLAGAYYYLNYRDFKNKN